MWRKQHDTLQSEKVVSSDLLINALSVPVWSLFGDIMRSYVGCHGITEHAVCSGTVSPHGVHLLLKKPHCYFYFTFCMLSTQLALFVKYHIWARHVEVFVWLVFFNCNSVETLTGHENNELPGIEAAHFSLIAIKEANCRIISKTDLDTAQISYWKLLPDALLHQETIKWTFIVFLFLVTADKWDLMQIKN